MRYTAHFIILLIIWFLLTAPWDPVSGHLDWQVTIVGIGVALLTAWLFADLFHGSIREFGSLPRLFWFVYYVPVFLYFVIVANLDVLYRVIHPNMPIQPGIVKVKTRLRSAAGVTALCNSITLTPGTLAVDLTEDGYIYVHWIYVRTTDMETATALIVRRFEDILIKIFPNPDQEASQS